MVGRKTYKRKPFRTGKKITRKQTNIKGGGLLWDSNREKIANYLLKSRAINKVQRSEILSVSNSGTKTEQIQKFVDASVAALTQNIIEAWTLIPNEIKNTPNSPSLNKVLNVSTHPASKIEQYNLAHNIYIKYQEMDSISRAKILDDGLMKLKLSDGRNGGMAFQLLYQLYKDWIDSNILQTLPSPKFADLYKHWFGKEIKTFFEKYWWFFI